MARTLSFSGNTSVLLEKYFPPIDIPGDYECGLLSLFTYNSIPNIDKSNNLFYIGSEIIEIPEGSYEIDDIINYITTQLKETKTKPIVSIYGNTNTLKTEIKSTHPIYFNKDNTIGSLLGFSKREIIPNKKTESDLPVNINKVNSIRVECSITTGAYMNSKPVHTIYEFSPNVIPGDKISENPTNIIYLPINVSEVIHFVEVKLVDQDGDLINFRNEQIDLKLHLKPTSTQIGINKR